MATGADVVQRMFDERNAHRLDAVYAMLCEDYREYLNGSPAKSAFETISITVNEVNSPPMIRKVTRSRARTVCPPVRYSRTTLVRSTVSGRSPRGELL